MVQAQGKVLLKFDVFPEEKERIEYLCKQFGITKIEFLRRAKAIAEDQPELFQSPPPPKNSAGDP
ncbi:hypothetical protein SBF1_7920002 [Candidatus Desulfosporosinus infrequens]|uniref:Uncharacterized protein n=1 Tax=Candidatus Desulfosporosinus infrequens TaxID=2043169 RepID=A0A2U3LSE1_9FIRM|nr:hypothetical protein SBF1_7920002 [Candidatus Desulfosporosinus infrequens]